MLSLRSISAVLMSLLLLSATAVLLSTGMIQTGPAPVKSPVDHTGPKWVLPPVPCTQEDCGFVCRHSDLLPFGCPGVNCYCLQNP
ncbi:hypothetical protein BRARA_J01264 [Brassica rapa]|uniref:Uncharacterized protein n=2 Tax=Brassica TaxID=3705 RepID=A0A397XK59_BRACM|nr:hypothetical protein BRARA_J01264 [Brassica rapa]CAF2332676.1 unnamed protein product [Brassica napus]CAG7910436.1 unnamed protein product [Brassica rapa]